MRKINVKNFPQKGQSFLVGKEVNGIVVKSLRATRPSREGASNYAVVLEDTLYGGKRRAATYNSVYKALTERNDDALIAAYSEGTYLRRSRAKQYQYA